MLKTSKMSVDFTSRYTSWHNVGRSFTTPSRYLRHVFQDDKGLVPGGGSGAGRNKSRGYHKSIIPPGPASCPHVTDCHPEWEEIFIFHYA
jgi:hypothetical protein